MKKIYFLLLTLLISGVSFAQSTGDIAFVGFNADADDNFAIVALADLTAGTTIYFSDDELDGAGGFADSNEGNIQWDITTTIPAGTIVSFNDTDSGSNAGFGVSTGTLTYVGSGTINLSGGGDALFAYTGTDENTPTTFLAGIQNETGNFGDLAGSGLTEGTTFVTFTASGNPDGGVYSGPRNSETSFANYLALIGNPANWTIENSDGTLLVPFDTTAFVESATATPTITVSGAITGLDYFENNGPSAEGTFTVAGTNLTADISLNADAAFEISTTSGNPFFSSSLNIPQVSGTVTTTTIYVRLAAGFGVNTFSEDVTASSTGATDVTVSVSGEVSPATPQITVNGNINSLDYEVGNGPSGEDSIFVSGLFLGSDITVTAPANFQVSLSTGVGFANSVTLSPDGGGSVSNTEVFVRMADNLAENTYSGDIMVSATGVTTEMVAVSGIVTPASTCSAVGSIIITEIMKNPSAAGDPAGEYFELYNTTTSAINIAGWILRDDASALETHTISSSLIVPAMGYIVVGNVSTTTPVLDYNYGNDLSMGNGTDGIVIECSSTIIDEVNYNDGTFPDQAGAAMELSTMALNATDNDDGANWADAISDIGNGDLGTPGAQNDNTLSVDTFENTNFSIYPNPTNTGFVNITTTANAAINVNVFDILGKQVISKTINNRLDVSNLKTGVYILQLNQNGATITKKLVIK